jgi:hypothetical protein
VLLQEYVDVAQWQTLRHVNCPCCPQQQLKKRLSFSLSSFVVSCPSKTAILVPFKLMMIVEFLSFAHTWPRSPSPSQPKSVELWKWVMFSQPFILGSRTYAAAAISAMLTTVDLSETSGPRISSTVQADAASDTTSPCSRAAAIIGSTTDGLRSANRCIFKGALRIISGGNSCGRPSSDVVYNCASGLSTSFRLCNVGYLLAP